MKWTAFDLEFTELLPDLDKEWPSSLKIACASIFSSSETSPQVWYELDPLSIMPGCFMSENTVLAFVNELENRFKNGHVLITWGGSSSDWRMLSRECPQKRDIIKNLALESIDIPLCSFMKIGISMGLNASAKALGFELKDESSSRLVPEKWTNINERPQVIQHVSNDSFITLIVFMNALNTSILPWISKKGELKRWNLKKTDLCTTRECLSKEIPQVSFPILPHYNAKIRARWLILK